MLSTIKNIVGRVVGANDPYSKADEVSKKYADAINTQYAAGIQNLQDQKKGIAAAYDPQRASVNAQYERGVRNNNEQMANLGLTRSGTNLTQQMALETERQRGIAEVNTAQAEAAQKLQAQINEYIAQRDSEIAQQSARLYENAYTTQQQFAHDKEMAAISHRYDQEMAALQHQYNIALSKNDHEQTAALQKEMAALEQSYNIATLEKQAELDKANYAHRAAIDWDYSQKGAALDWDYYQKQAALDNINALNLYNSKASTDWDYYQKQAALDNSNALSLYNSKASTDWNYYQKQAALDNSNALSLYNSKASTDWDYYQKQAALGNKYKIGSDVNGDTLNHVSGTAKAIASSLRAQQIAGDKVGYEKLRAEIDNNSSALSENDVLWLMDFFNID
ncbi:MAG: hypothetical protein IIW48_07370 [Clostridia bacterium]|nr:hypothetical protein [Clostridia bacterium]